MIPETRTTLLSVDPGTSSGWALWTATLLGPATTWTLNAYGRLHDPDAGTVWALLQWLSRDCTCYLPGAQLVVEGQWLASMANWHSVSQLVACRATWVSACTIAGMTTEAVQPCVWIPAATAGAAEPSPKPKSSDAKVKATVRRLIPKSRVVADEAAAILLGHWWLKSKSQTVDLTTTPVTGLKMDALTEHP